MKLSNMKKMMSLNVQEYMFGKQPMSSPNFQKNSNLYFNHYSWVTCATVTAVPPGAGERERILSHISFKSMCSWFLSFKNWNCSISYLLRLKRSSLSKWHYGYLIRARLQRNKAAKYMLFFIFCSEFQFWEETIKFQ